MPKTTASTEVKNSTKTIPRSLLSSWFIVLLLGVLILVTCTLSPPGAGDISRATFPMIEIITYKYGPQWRTFGLIMQYPSLFVAGICVLWAATRQSWALSRAGYVSFDEKN
jgi:amino acid transporter